MAGPSAGVRLSATGGDGRKAGNGNEKEDWSGRRQDPLTPGPETTAVALGSQHKTVEKGGGREEAWPGESTCEEGDTGPGMGVYGESDGEDRSGIEERVGNRPNRKASRSVIRPEREATRHDWRPRCTSRNTRWEPVSARRGPSGRKDKDSVGDRERKEPSTPMLNTSAVADQRKTEEMAGGGEELETDAGDGSTVEARHETHAIRPVEGQETSTHTANGRQRVTDDDGRVKPSRGKRGTKEGAGRDEAMMRATKGPDTEVGKGRYLSKGVREKERDTKRAIRPHEGQATSTGMMVCSTAKEHGRRREGGRCAMGSSKDRSTSTHSGESIDIRGKPTEGKRGAERVGTPRCAARKGRKPECDRRDPERIRRSRNV